MRTLVCCLIASLILSIGVIAKAGVEQTKHNFSSSAYSPNAFFWGTNRVCVFCHTVHNADQGSGPLWNHEVDAGQPYTMYDSPTMDMNQSPTPHMGSLICLSCHDGTIAVNSLNNVPGPGGAGTYGTPGGAGLDGVGRLSSSSHAYVGTDLSDDHPVGITYDSTQDTNFQPKTGNGQSYPDKLLSDGLYVECTSCHNPHDDTYSDFLIESNASSALCLRCHIQ
jgi:predicted CXXCH cytochrome family protein